MDLGLRAKNCIVVGGSRGIGRAIALGLAAEGANVAVCARQAEPLREAESAIAVLGVRVHTGTCDVGDATSLTGFLDAARDAFGSIDVLVHNASALAVGPQIEDWEASLRVDLLGAVHACEHVLPWMIEAGGGSILLVSSISGLEADPAPDFAYSSAKAALIAYAKKLAVMYAPQRIRANAIAPGSTDFPGGFWAGLREREPGLYEATRASIPWGRLGTPEEIANVAVFLLSPRASWVTGECVSVDGGQHRGMR